MNFIKFYFFLREKQQHKTCLRLTNQSIAYSLKINQQQFDAQYIQALNAYNNHSKDTNLALPVTNSKQG